MFLLPAHNSTSEEEKEDAERYARARVEQRIKEPPQVNRVLYGKEDMRTHQVWLAGYITRCEWLLEAYGLDDRESRKIESNEVVTDYVWNVLRDDDWSGKTPPSRVSNATVSSL